MKSLTVKAEIKIFTTLKVFSTFKTGGVPKYKGLKHPKVFSLSSISLSFPGIGSLILLDWS